MPTAGLTYSQAGFSQKVGDVALQLQEAFDAVRNIKAYLAQYSGTQLDTMYGYDAGQGVIVKSAFDDADLLRTIYEGTATQGTTKDFRAFLKQIYGLGIA